VLRDQPGLSNFDLLGLAVRTNVLRGSITNLELVERALNEYEIDTCFHLAAQAIVGAANRSPLSTFESNIKGTWVVLEACRLSRLVERVVVASSDKAYGSQPVLPYTEEMPLLASNPYDASKACADILALSYHTGFGMPLGISRCANVYGGGDLNFSRLIPGTIRSALLRRPPVVRSDGTPVRDYLHVQDAVNAYLVLAERLGDNAVRGQAFNFGTDNPIRAIDLVRVILELCDASDLEPEVRGHGSLAGEIDQQFLDSRKAASVLGWVPAKDIKSGLREAIEWYRAIVLSPAAPEVDLGEPQVARRASA
jgi:CDP-glucose 4,6-dehydratase